VGYNRWKGLGGGEWQGGLHGFNLQFCMRDDATLAHQVGRSAAA
jgi:hypothetical protein